MADIQVPFKAEPVDIVLGSYRGALSSPPTTVDEAKIFFRYLNEFLNLMHFPPKDIDLWSDKWVPSVQMECIDSIKTIAQYVKQDCPELKRLTQFFYAVVVRTQTLLEKLCDEVESLVRCNRVSEPSFNMFCGFVSDLYNGYKADVLECQRYLFLPNSEGSAVLGPWLQVHGSLGLEDDENPWNVVCGKFLPCYVSSGSEKNPCAVPLLCWPAGFWNWRADLE